MLQASRSTFSVPIARLFFKVWAIFSPDRDAQQGGRLIPMPSLMSVLVSEMLRGTSQEVLGLGR